MNEKERSGRDGYMYWCHTSEEHLPNVMIIFSPILTKSDCKVSIKEQFSYITRT